MRRRGWPAVARATPSLRPASPGRVSSRLSLPSHLDCRGAEVGISISYSYMEGNDDLPAWIGTINKWLPVVRNLGAVAAMLGLPTLGGESWRSFLIAWPIYLFLGYWSVINNHGWTHTARTNATIERTRQRQSELVRWPRLFEQKIRVAKWIVGRG